MPIYKSSNYKFFKKWSHDMAYILGFLFADGNIVVTKRGTHFVSMYSADRGLLESISLCMKSDHKIGERRTATGVVYRIQVGSREYFDDLLALGLTPNKSKRMRIPTIPKKYIGDFVRGYFDGDGNVWSGLIHKDRRTRTRILQVFFTSASVGYLSELLSLLRSAGLSGGSLVRPKKGSFGRISISTLDALKIYKIMYNSPSRLFLARKRVIFETFIQMRS